MNFSKRSYEKELLDRDDIPFEHIKRNMQELDFINRKLGGHQITISGLQALMRAQSRNAKHQGREVSILEIGCGGGDNLRVIKKYCDQKKIPARLAGVDINPHCIE